MYSLAPKRINCIVSLLSCPWKLQLSRNVPSFTSHDISRGISNKLTIYFNPLLPLSFIQAYYHDKASNLLKTWIRGREMGIRQKNIYMLYIALLHYSLINSQTMHIRMCFLSAPCELKKGANPIMCVLSAH